MTDFVISVYFPSVDLFERILVTKATTKKELRHCLSLLGNIKKPVLTNLAGRVEFEDLKPDFYVVRSDTELDLGLTQKLQELDARLSKMDMDKLSLTHSYLKPPTFTRQERVLTKYQISDETRQWLKEPTFNNWLWEDNELAELVCQMYVDLELTKIFDIPHKTLKSFVNVCKSSYNVTPFHNFKHAFMVTQMCYTIIHFTGLVDKMTPLEKLSMLTACLGHDLNHPGYNNAYQINADTELALIYNDQAVLENHHASMLFCILSHDQSNITANLDGQQKRQFRKLVLKCILATDMSKHGEIVNGFKKIAPEFKYEDEAHRHELFSMLIKCSDISTEVRPPHVAERWVDLLLEEFFSQSDREKHEGLPTMPFMDREKVTKPSAQIGFIQFVMIPLYETLGMVLQMGPLIEPIRNALQYYKDLQQAAKDAQAK